MKKSFVFFALLFLSACVDDNLHLNGKIVKTLYGNYYMVRCDIGNVYKFEKIDKNMIDSLKR